VIKGDNELSVESILQSLKELTNVHKQLCNVSQQKTEALKKGSSEKLQDILREEQTYIRKLEQVENNRERIVEQWFENNQSTEQERTITKILNLLTDENEKRRLEVATIDLTKEITRLRDLEQLNAALIQQSMHFIQTSLNMLKPTLQSLNYDRQQTKNDQKRYNDRSMFDSKA